MTNKEMFFISGAWNTGIGVVIHGYDFIISTVQTVGFSKQVVIRNSNHSRQFAKVVFVDYSTGLAFIEKKIEQQASLDVMSFQMAVLPEPIVVYQTNYYNKLIVSNEELMDVNIEINNIKYLEIKGEKQFVIGSVVLNRRQEFVGLTTVKEGKNLVLHAKYILKAMEEYKNITGDGIRCPNCLKVVPKIDIIDSICPVCSAEIIPELLKDMLPSMTKVDMQIETIIKKMGINIEKSRLGQHYWEIIQGSATIFIRYEPQMRFIVAFSALCELSDKDNKKIYQYLIEENSLLKFLSFSVDKNRVFLSAPYIVDDNFDDDFADELFRELFEKSDYYDDILMKMI